jgi:hypothetical protein
MPSLLASLRQAERDAVRVGHGRAADVLVAVGSASWKDHGPIDVVRAHDLRVDAMAVCGAIALEAAKTDRLSELRLAVLRLALKYGAEAEIFADNDQDWRETTHVTLRPRPREASLSVADGRRHFSRTPQLAWSIPSNRANPT